MRRNALVLTLALAAIAAGCGAKTDQLGTGGSGYKDGANFDVAVVKPQGGIITGNGGTPLDPVSVVTGHGTLPDGTVACGTLNGVDSAKCDARVGGGASIVLTATPDTGYTFRTWAGDCSGTGLCTLTGAANAYKRVVAVFDPVAGAEGGTTTAAVQSRLYGYALNGATKIAGVTVGLFDPTANASTAVPVLSAASSSSAGYVLTVAPGTYNVVLYKENATTKFRTGYGTPFTFTIPDGSCGIGSFVALPPVPAYKTQPSFAKSGQFITGCLVNMDLATTATNAAAAAVSVTATPSAQFFMGFGQPVNLACNAGPDPDPALTITRTWAWTLTKGPVALDPIAAGSTATITSPTLAQIAAATAAADAPSVLCPMGAGAGKPGAIAQGTTGGNANVGCGVSNFYFRGRPELFTVTKQMSGELTYTFTCTVTDTPQDLVNFKKATYTGTTTVQLAGFVNANESSFVKYDPSNLTTVFYGRAMFPAGQIVIADDGPVDTTNRTGYDWAVFTDTLATVPAAGYTVQNSNTANPWFVSQAAASANLYLINRLSVVASAANQSKDKNFVDSLVFRPQTWSGALDSCAQCHNPNPPNNATNPNATGPWIEWSASKHAGIVIDGMGGDHYTTSCLPCHTEGYQDGLPSQTGWFQVYNNGNNTLGAGGTAYKFPVFTFEGLTSQLQFANMPAALQKLSNVQCQSCHGATNATKTGHTASLSADVCGVCHDGGHHGIYSQWRTEKHGNLSVAQAEGTGCGVACHGAQGATMYIAQRALPSNLGLAPKNVTVAGLTTNNVEPISCQVCHNPHSLELTIDPSVAMTASGYKLGAASGAPSSSLLAIDGTYGKGVLCATCHNSRRAIGEQMDPTVINSVTASSTHLGPQTDVYMGKSMFFFDTTKKPATNVHNSEWFKDSCVDCHVKLIQSDFPTIANHTFDAGYACATCHGGGMLPDGTPSKGKAVMDATDAQMEAINEAAGQSFMDFVTLVGSVTMQDNADAGTSVKGGGGTPYVIYAGQITKVALGDVHGNMALKVWLNGNPTNLPDLQTQFGNIWDQTGTVKVFPGDASNTSTGRNAWFNKVVWNHNLIESDASHGIHNMLVIKELLSQSLNMLQTTTLQ
jgi:hypothetical protein